MIIYNNGPLGLPDGDLSVFMAGVQRRRQTAAQVAVSETIVELTCTAQVSAGCAGTFKTSISPKLYMREGLLVCDACAQEAGGIQSLPPQRGFRLWAQ